MKEIIKLPAEHYLTQETLIVNLFLLCFFKIGAWKLDDLEAVGLKVFPA